MNKVGDFLRWVQASVLVIVLCLSTPWATATERNLTRTNWTERWITNFIEVRMPKNIFVDEFHTNWVPHSVTNVVEVFATNWITVSRTNWTPVEMVHTNFVAISRTNWRTLTLTNWETVLVMKTNWVTQPVTNVVQIDLITNRVAFAEPASKAAPVKEESLQPVPFVATDSTSEIQFEASRTSRPPNRNVVEVLLKARWTGTADTQLQIRQWRVESENGAILCYSQEQDFTRELPVGRYRIEVRAQKDGNGPLLAGRGIVDLTAANATMLPLASARK